MFVVDGCLISFYWCLINHSKSKQLQSLCMYHHTVSVDYESRTRFADDPGTKKHDVIIQLSAGATIISKFNQDPRVLFQVQSGRTSVSRLPSPKTNTARERKTKQPPLKPFSSITKLGKYPLKLIK